MYRYWHRHPYYTPMPTMSPAQYYPNAFATAPAPKEKTYSEDLIRKNIGSRVTVYMTFPQNDQWRGKVFSVILQDAGRDYFVILDTHNHKEILLLSVNLDYMTIDAPPAAAKATPSKATRKPTYTIDSGPTAR